MKFKTALKLVMENLVWRLAVPAWTRPLRIPVIEQTYTAFDVFEKRLTEIIEER